jgi:hypothetical protein
MFAALMFCGGASIKQLKSQNRLSELEARPETLTVEQLLALPRRQRQGEGRSAERLARGS